MDHCSLAGVRPGVHFLHGCTGWMGWIPACAGMTVSRDWIGTGDWTVGFLQAIGGWVLQAVGDRLLDLTRFREVISPTAGGFALGFLLSFSMSRGTMSGGTMPGTWRAVAGAVAEGTAPGNAVGDSLLRMPVATGMLMVVGRDFREPGLGWGWFSIACGMQHSIYVLI